MNNKAKYLIVLGAFVIFTFIGYKTLKKDEIVIQSNQIEIEEPKIFVHVEGCVQNPGVLEIEKGTRIYEILELAGGRTDDADLSKINLASIAVDAQKIYVPAKASISQNNVSQVAGETLININTASKEELQTLPGIGPSTAQKIIDYRESEGYFSNVEDIMNVSGIGEGKFSEIKNDIVT